MILKLIQITIEESEILWRLQVEAFRELLEKYQDYATNPGNESVDRVKEKLRQPFTYFYFICIDEKIVGAIRVVDRKDGTRKRVAPIFILKEYRGRGFAQQTFQEIEKIHGDNHWELDTILQEIGNCYLYEKLGYQKVGELERIKDGMDIVYYQKN